MPEDACRSVASRVVPGLTATSCFLFLRAFQSLLPAIFWLITNLSPKSHRTKNLALSKSRVTYLLPVCKTKKLQGTDSVTATRSPIRTRRTDKQRKLREGTRRLQKSEAILMPQADKKGDSPIEMK